ncbi:ATP-dependent DNA helicase homolog RECG, chloroplastic-like [Zingiber officinale]|uniref:ATP-dependent DNA helicase homolog RECG, chloroplastic-like n=1 Tax=Zingiber officinale TaxID=94328 RepID=UPI001C4C7192|nr:ATP-dependent DNA helicase homolog RECG, chloroplastic-like [Zingiber officinale]XP_042437360.1 ATP-dependent DNA helicase homolog RECG, chloroplastic-like [Zingiber officinale]
MTQLAASFVQACLKGFNERHLTSAIYFEAESGFRNTLSRSMRFSNFLHSKLLTWSSRHNHMSAKKLLDEVTNYSTASTTERSQFLDKISVFMGYTDIKDLIEQEKNRQLTTVSMDDAFKEFDSTLICTKFPCIKVGNASSVGLYEEVPHAVQVKLLGSDSCNEYLPITRPKWEELDKFAIDGLQPFDPLTGVDSLNPEEDNSNVMLFDSQIAQSDDNSNVMLFDSQIAQSNAETKGNTQETSQMLLESTTSESVLDKPIRSLPGITSRKCQQLEDSGFYTVRKLLHHFPRSYADLKNAQGAIDEGQYLMFVGTVLSSRGIKASSSFSFLEVVVGCELLKNGQDSKIENDCGTENKKMVYLHLKKFFRGTRFTYHGFLKSIESKYREGDCVYVSGKVSKKRTEDHYEMREYNVDTLVEEGNVNLQRRPFPLYPSKAGLDQKIFSDMISRVLKMLTANMDPIPDEILKEFNLPNLREAYMGIHQPMNLDEAELSRRRLIFDEFFYLQLGKLFQMVDALATPIEKERLLEKYKNHELNSVCVEDWSELTKKLLRALPYSLTPSQQNAVSEIIWDLKRPVPMNRLLQGDVGCGKTVVAFLACMEVISSGFQAAFMVPTELLAIQHYELLLSLLENIGQPDCKPSIALLTGSTSRKQSHSVLKGLHTGEISMVIGTHSLIAEKVKFNALRLTVIDEQHRFGVIQRGKFNSKLYSASRRIKLNWRNLDDSVEEKDYMAPHVLAMSATPIPRTLALALYGDMSLTQITDMPPGRVPVQTFAFEGNKIGFKKLFQMMRDELTGSGKVYLVYPVITGSEQLPMLRAATAEFESISERFKGYQCGLLHGRMTGDQKADALRQFRSGETRILLATQVIEIGVDIPDASLMVVMNAEKFGIAQLHQLRGRVGRGERKSKCIFLSSTSGGLNRLKVLERSSDGFYLANADLLLRGPGNLLGKKQSGHIPEFPIARLEIDGNILQEAQLAALNVLGASNDLQLFPKLLTELSMRQPLCILGD